MSDVSPDPSGIPDDMIDRAAQQLWHLDVEQYADFPLSDWDKVTEDNRERYRVGARKIMAGALAGRMVVDLPEPDETDAENVGYWGDVYTGDFVSSRPPNGEPGDFLHGVTLGGLIRTGSLKPERAEQVAGWLLAAAQHARTAKRTDTVVDLPGVAGGGACHD